MEALALPSEVVTNRIRRALLERRADLVDTAVHGRALHDRQTHPGGAHDGANRPRSCVVQ